MPQIPLERVEEIEMPKGKKKLRNLQINTEAINEKYNFGGEGGQQTVITEKDEEEELEKITRLVKKCLNKMNKVEEPPE